MNKELEVKIDKTLIRKPVYEYKTGQIIYLSHKEQVLVDTYMETQNVHECSRQIKEQMKMDISVPTCWRWLQKRRIAGYIVDKMKDKAMANGYDQDKWIAEGIKYKNGDLHEGTKLTMLYWKEIGKALGYYKTPDILQQLNTQINFTQADGKE